MIAGGIFVIAGIIAWQNIPKEIEIEEKEDVAEGGFFAFAAFVCWVVAALCCIGVISQN